MFIRVEDVVSDGMREALYRFRYRIYAEELGKELPGMDHGNRVYQDDLDPVASLLVAVEQQDKRIVGTVRTIIAKDHSLTEMFAENVGVERLIRRLGADRVSYSGAFMVDREFRGKTVASILAMAGFRNEVRAGIAANVIVAELALVHLYYMLGYRPIGRPTRRAGTDGLRVPLVLAIADKAYLTKVESPFRHLLPDDLDDQGETAAVLKELYPDFQEPAVTPLEKRALWAALARGTEEERDEDVFGGLSSEVIQGLLSTLTTITLSPGERLYQVGETERGMGVILSGALGVTLEETEHPHYVAVLRQGQLCGEMAGLVAGGRTASLIALEDSELILLPHNLLEKLEKRDLGAAYKLSRNLNRLLGQRLSAMNRRYLEDLSERVPPKPITAPAQPPEADEASLQESYSIATLGDQEGEVERLEMQALLGWGLELKWLSRLGFRDGMTVLDLGSGPGLTSFMLARSYASSRFIGVEPEALLRERAVSKAHELGLSDRCRFVAGHGEEIPLPDNAVDGCYVRFVFQHVPRPMAILEELKRVTRPGGIIVVLDVDDGAIVVHPEPDGVHDFHARTAAAQAELGGDRHVCRKMVSYMTTVGLVHPRIEVEAVTSQDLPAKALVRAAFSFKAQILARSGLLTESDKELMEQLETLCESPDSWLLVPVFFCHGIA